MNFPTFIIKNNYMANETHTLRIGNNDYPIYGNGIKLHEGCGNKFVTTDVEYGNANLSISDTIHGDNNVLDISSQKINISGDNVVIGNSIIPSNSKDDETHGVNIGGEDINDHFNNLYILNGYSKNGWAVESDDHLMHDKHNIKIDFEALSTLQKLYYVLKDSDDIKIGISAQDLLKIYPELVSLSKSNTYNIQYDKLSVIALAAIDELYNENIKLKNDIDNVKTQLNNIDERIKIILNNNEDRI